MKIVLCTRRFVVPFIGGVDVYSDRLRRAFLRLGHEVIIVAFDSRSDQNGLAITTEADEYDKTRVIRIKFSFSNRPKEYFDLAYDPELGSVAGLIFKQEKPDIIVFMNFYTLSLSVVQEAKKQDIPVAHIATDFLPICRRGTLIRFDGKPCKTGESIKACSSCFVTHRLLGKFGAKILNQIPEEHILRWSSHYDLSEKSHPRRVRLPYLKQAAVMKKRLEVIKPIRESIDVILAPTRYTAEMFQKSGLSKPGQVYYLPFAVDAIQPTQNQKFFPVDHTRFLFIGRLQPYKGAHLLVDAFLDLANPKGSTLTIYGTPDGHEPYYEHLRKKIALHPHIRFAGKIANTDLVDAFSKADYFVLPSIWHENSPLILLDALQLSTPVIASDIGGVSDLIEDCVNGILFPMGDKQALQQVLQSVIDQPLLRAKLTRNNSLPLIDDYANQVIELCVKQNEFIS
jgi:glycosyltransferase involved in cell wall biosynthesis